MYIDVIIPLAIPEILSYTVEREEDKENIIIGSLVAILLGKKRAISALVISIHHSEGTQELKPILSVIDPDSNISDKQLEFWRWIGSYYFHPIGEVTHHLLPPSLRIQAEATDREDGTKEFIFPKIYGFRNREYISLTDEYNNSEKLIKLLETLNRSKAKTKLIESFGGEVTAQSSNLDTYKIEKKSLLNVGGSASTLKQLIESGVFRSEIIAVKESFDALSIPLSTETTAHEEYCDLVEKASTLLTTKPTLLVKTSSQTLKKEIFKREIRERLSEGGEVLIITPTPLQSRLMYNELSVEYGDIVILSDNQNTKDKQHSNYNKILFNKGALIVVGGRRAVALPFSNLKLVIVEDEHESSYKGSEFELQFGARDSAIYLAHLHRAKSILTSIAPSVESYHNCMTGKYALLEHKSSFIPEITAIERRSIAPKERKVISSSSDRRFISTLLLDQIDERMRRGEISFLYQNRKGFATVIECKECGEYIQCDNCNVTLTYHKTTDSMVCKYCSSHYKRATECRACGSKSLQMQGIGTENVEDKISKYFPLSRVIRIDSESVENRKKYSDILDKIKAGEVDIIVGTDLFTKFNNLDKLTLIGVINGDNMFAFPEYFTAERAYQSIISLLYRLPKSKDSRMVIQISGKHPIYKYIKQDDYHSFYLKEIEDRRKFTYPPFCKIITFTLKNRDITKVETSATNLANDLTAVFGKRCSGVYTPQIDKIRNEYIMQIVVKIEKGADIVRAKDIISKLAKKHNRPCRLTITTT